MDDNTFNKGLMQKVFLFLLVILSLSAKATNYYFSNAGSDGNSGTLASPWATITKLNSVWNAGTLAPGDSVLFRRGDSFYGKIIVKESGSLSQPIILSGYNTGAKPIITGMTTLSGWTALGGGLYEIFSSAFLSTCSVVVVDGLAYAMGRYPNSTDPWKGYLSAEFHTGSTSITDNQLTGTPNWTGAEVVIRTNRYILDRATITSHAGSTLTFTPATQYPPSNGYGYFFENDIRTLDKLGEWYYKPSTKKLTMFFGDALPASYTIQAATIDTLFEMSNFYNVVLNGLAFQGANKRAIDLYSVDAGESKILNCDIKYCGENAMFLSTSSNVLVDGNVIEDAYQHGIYCSGGSYYTVTNNSLKRIAVFQGHAGGINANTAIRVSADHSMIQYNTVDSTGYMSIRIAGNNDTIKNNFCQHYTMIVDDGSGIYTGNGTLAGGGSPSIHSGDAIIGNIVLNGLGALEGTTAVNGATHGIYLDDNTNGIIVDGNSVANNNLSGVFLHNNFNVKARDNTLYNNTFEQLLYVHNSPESKPRTLVLSRNIFFAKTAAQFTMKAQTDSSDINFTLWWTSNDSNYHARPLSQNVIIRAIRPAFQQSMTVPNWFTFSAFEQHSLGSPKTYGAINPDDSIRFEYNATKVNKTVLLSGTYMEVNGTTYTGSVTLAPYTSKILMSTAYAVSSVGTAPVVTITGPAGGSTYLAAAEIALTASASDSIASVKWYSNGTLIDTETSDPYSFLWTGVPAGSYLITAVAMDVNGLSTTSAGVSVTVSNPVIIPSGTIYIHKILIVQ